MSRYDWMEAASCAHVDPDLWHADSNGGRYLDATRICNRCPVQRECAAHAASIEGDTSKRDRHGLWAGNTPRERLAHSDHQDRESRHDVILRLANRGGMDPYEIAEFVGCDVRTVWRVTKKNREQIGEAA